MPYILHVHTVIETGGYLDGAKAAGASDETLAEIADTISTNPTAGVVIPGSGGARKLRFRAKGRGKRGGYRTIHYYAAPDVPVFLLDFIDKADREDIPKAELNQLRKLLGQIADTYREGVKAIAHKPRG